MKMQGILANSILDNQCLFESPHVLQRKVVIIYGRGIIVDHKHAVQTDKVAFD